MTLLRKLIPAIPWIPWLPATAGVSLLALAMRSLQPDFASRQLYLRGGLLLAALALSFAFDDPAAETSDSAPSPLWVRRALRLAIALVSWAALVAVSATASARSMEPVIVLSAELNLRELPVGRLLLEAATMASWGLATAAIVVSRGHDEPGKIASGALLVLYAAAWMIPDQWKPWASPTDPRWTTALSWWWAALGAGLLITGILSWDSRQGGAVNRYRHRRIRETSPAGRKDAASERNRINTG